MKDLIRNLLFLFITFHGNPGFSQEVTWYLPWENRINKLVEDSTLEVPIINKYANYRILEISSKDPVTLSNITIESNNSEVKIYYAPIVFDYNGREILDVLKPVDQVTIGAERNHYFFIKFTGKKPGSETVSVNIHSKDSVIYSTKNIYVSNAVNNFPFSINTWAYFDYDFLTKGIREQVIQDLYDSKNDFLIIPHSYFPKVEKDIDELRIDKLREYIKNTDDKFKYYVLFFDYRSEYTSILSDKWKKDFLVWIEKINKVFAENGVSESRILLYPYDEPQGDAINKASEMYDWIKSNNIKNPLYVTIGGKDRKKALRLVQKTDFAQIASDLVESVSATDSKRTTLLLYTVAGSSRNIRPITYLRYAGRAYKYGIQGIGVWHYSNMKGAFDVDYTIDLYKKPSWELEVLKINKDYSLIYRESDKLYSSIRWKALSYGVDEYQFFKLYETMHGKTKTDGIIHDIFNSNVMENHWEKVKLQFIKKM